MNTKTPHERLVELVKSAGGPTAFAKRVGMHRAWISALVSGSKEFGPGGQVKMAQRLGRHPGWFMEAPAATAEAATVPIKEWEAADKPAPPGAELLRTGLDVGPEGYALLMQSEAMTAATFIERSIPPGVYVLVDPSQPWGRGNDIIIRMTPGATPCVRRVLEDGPNKYVKAMNPAFPGAYQITASMRVLGRVVGIQASY